MNGRGGVVQDSRASLGHGLENILDISRPSTKAKMNKGWLELESDPGEKCRDTTRLTLLAATWSQMDSLHEQADLKKQCRIKWLHVNVCVVQVEEASN